MENTPIVASLNIPIPTRTPIAEVHHIVAEVVNPFTEFPSFTIIPIHIKDMPDTIWAITLLASELHIPIEIKLNKVLPNVINEVVLIPITLCWFSLSSPISTPNIIDIIIFINIILVYHLLY